MVLDIDRDAARRLGVDMRMITSVLNNSFSQRQVSTLYDSLNQYRVVMEVDPSYTQDPATLDQVQVIAADGPRVPLSAFATGPTAWRRTASATTSSSPRRTSASRWRPASSLDQALTAIDRAMAGIMLPTDVQARLSGKAGGFEKRAERQRWLILGALLAVYLVLGMLYESFVHPLTILSTLPSAGVGALLALMAFGTEFSLICAAGAVPADRRRDEERHPDDRLRAVAREREDGLAADDAICEAAQLRLRPILMTNLAALLGALPLLLATGEGAEMRRRWASRSSAGCS